MSFGTVQSVFAMNMASNATSGFIDTPANLQALLATYLNGGTYSGNYGTYVNGTWTQTQAWPGFFNTLNPSMIGKDWSVVWGPCVYVDLAEGDSTGSTTNAAFVAYSPSQKSYVVSVSATNLTSLVDWLSEDVNVAPKNRVTWSDFNPINLTQLTLPTDPQKNAPVPMIDAGTALGVTNLLTQLSDASQPANSQTLGDFLLNLPTTTGFPNKATLYFSGHSLGGALTQVLPLYLYNALSSVNSGTGNPIWGQIITMPTAGPTPGNSTFADLFNATFSGDIAADFPSVPYWNSDVISSADVVPAAWNNLISVFSAVADSAGNYPSFYGMLGTDTVSISIPPLGINLTSVPFGQAMGDLSLALGTYASYYSPIRQIPFNPTQGCFSGTEGTRNWTPYTLPTDDNPIESLKVLSGYVLHSHVDQYLYFFLGEWGPQFPSLNPALKQKQKQSS